jgi:predicted acetyltransferase
MAFTLRPIAAGEVAAFRAALVSAFGGDATSEPDDDHRLTEILPLERSCAAFDGATLVATSGAFGLDMTVPGGALRCAGLTMVTVAPTHRRRGVLRALIGAHLHGAAERGDAISALWASEAAIYGRFGYGLASEFDELRVADARSLRFTDELGRDELAPLDDAGARAQLPWLYDRLCHQRAGMLVRPLAWWEQRHFHDPPQRRAGASRRRWVLARRDGQATGYLCFRQRPGFTAGLPTGSAEVVELLAADARAEASLLELACRIDLHPTMTWWNAPVDLALPWLTDNARGITRRRSDALWVRICDVPAALAARRYERDGALVLRVADPLGRDAAGTYALRAVAGAGQCERTTAGPDLALDTGALGSLYLGGVRASTLGRAGRIAGSPAALATADALFSTRTPPWCSEIF